MSIVEIDQPGHLCVLIRTLQDSSSHKSPPGPTVFTASLRNGITLVALRSSTGTLRGWLVRIETAAIKKMDKGVSWLLRLLDDDLLASNNASMTVLVKVTQQMYPTKLVEALGDLLLLDYNLPPCIAEKITYTCDTTPLATQLTQNLLNEEGQKHQAEAGGDGSASDTTTTPPMYGPKAKGRTLGEVPPDISASVNPDLVLYDAGLDPHKKIARGRLLLSSDGLFHRDMQANPQISAR
ncbi:hypothetical protein WJX74_000105 [Apatococcus lobatus]|uniref:Uncharacterized protein n=1 Tax=Apatococcus lobatus TaxID=904363 RepID=A0AAW1R1S8_9CHLO